MTDAERQERDLGMRGLDAGIAHPDAQTAMALRERRRARVVVAAVAPGLTAPVLTPPVRTD